MSKLRVFALDSDHCVGGFRDVVFMVWVGHTTVAAAAGLPDPIEQTAAAWPHGIGVLTIVAESGEFPSRESRDAIAHAMRRVSSNVVCSAFVHEGTGFRAATIRSVATGVSLIARQPFPHKVFETAERAIAWLLSRLHRNRSETNETKEYISALRELRASQLQQHPPEQSSGVATRIS